MDRPTDSAIENGKNILNAVENAPEARNTEAAVQSYDDVQTVHFLHSYSSSPAFLQNNLPVLG